MGLLSLPGRQRDQQSNKSRAARQKRVATIPLKGHPASENICCMCNILKKGTTWNEVLYEFVCRNPKCRRDAKELIAREKNRLNREKRKQHQQLMQAYYEKQLEDAATQSEEERID